MVYRFVCMKIHNTLLETVLQTMFMFFMSALRSGNRVVPVVVMKLSSDF